MTLEEIETDARRYRKLKKLTPQQYRTLYGKWLSSEAEPFDALLDAFDATVVEETLGESEIWGEPLVEDADTF